jgi:predicted transcriptional regulator
MRHGAEPPWRKEARMKVSDIMSRKLFFVTRDEPLSRAAALLAEASIGVLPVVDSPATMHLMGIITDRDITVRHVAKCHQTDCTVGSHMSEGNLVTVREDDHIHDLMGRMRHYRVRRVPVVDQAHRLIGIVSQADVAVHVGPNEPLEFERMMEAVSAPAIGAV